jgi:hypothetical protein
VKSAQFRLKITHNLTYLKVIRMLLCVTEASLLDAPPWIGKETALSPLRPARKDEEGGRLGAEELFS